MRAWLYDTLTNDPDLVQQLGGTVDIAKTRVMPRQSQDNFNLPKPFVIYGLGNDTNESLAEDDDHIAHRQFLEVWIHDDGGDYSRIDDMCEMVKNALVNKNHPPDNVTTIAWLETSAEFNNITYNTIFRYVRLQAIISKGAAA